MWRWGPKQNCAVLKCSTKSSDSKFNSRASGTESKTPEYLHLDHREILWCADFYEQDGD